MIYQDLTPWRCDFSVIVPSFNPNEWLLQAIDSIVVQERSLESNISFEIIVVDDASTLEASCRILDLAAQHPHATLYRLEANSGPSAARNFGIDRANGKWICFLDADDLWMPGTLQTFYKNICRFPNAVWFAGDHLRIDNAGIPVRGPEYTRHSGLAYCLPPIDSGEAVEINESFRHAIAGYLFHLIASCVERGALRGVGGFDPSLRTAEDHDLWLKLAAARHAPIYIAKTLACYRINSDSITNTRRSVPYPNLWRVYVKHISTEPGRRCKQDLRVRILDTLGSNVYRLRESRQTVEAFKESLKLLRYLPLALFAWRHLVATVIDFFGRSPSKRSRTR